MAAPIPLRWTAVFFVLAMVCSPTLALAGTFDGGSRNGSIEPDGDAAGGDWGRNGIGPSAVVAAALESPPSLRRRVKKEKSAEAKDGGDAGAGAGAGAGKDDRGETKVSNKSKKKGDMRTGGETGEEEMEPTSSTAPESSATTPAAEGAATSHSSTTAATSSNTTTTTEPTATYSNTTTATEPSEPGSNRTGDAAYAHAHVWTPKPFPCEPGEPDPSAPARGVYYVKIPKTNSTHWRDVFLRSSRHRSAAALTVETRECYTDAGHMDVAADARLRHRDRDRSLLTTFVRDVRDWKAANYYHKLAKIEGSLPSARAMASFVTRKRNGQARYIRTLDSFDAYGGAGASPVEVARAIMAEYDFIGVVDDPDRSLVCMRMLFGLKPRDILYNPSHLAGSISFRAGDSKDGCLPILPNYVFPEVEGVMSGEIWMAENAIDLALYNETRRSLEATIDSLGRDEFERALQEHRELMGRVREKCLPMVRYRCSETGAFQKEDDCGVGGCGHHCIHDAVVGAHSG